MIENFEKLYHLDIFDSLRSIADFQDEERNESSQTYVDYGLTFSAKNGDSSSCFRLIVMEKA